jgi:hypothetical protein
MTAIPISPQSQRHFLPSRDGSPLNPVIATESFAATLRRTTATFDLAIPFDMLGMFGLSSPSTLAQRPFLSTQEPQPKGQDVQAAPSQTEIGSASAREHMAQDELRWPGARMRSDARPRHFLRAASDTQHPQTIIEQRTPPRLHGKWSTIIVQEGATRRHAHTASKVMVYFHSTEAGARVCARIGRMEPTERLRLRQAIERLLAEYGVLNARILLNGLDAS